MDRYLSLTCRMSEPLLTAPIKCIAVGVQGCRPSRAVGMEQIVLPSFSAGARRIAAEMTRMHRSLCPKSSNTLFLPPLRFGFSVWLTFKITSVHLQGLCFGSYSCTDNVRGYLRYPDGASCGYVRDHSCASGLDFCV